MDSSNPRRFKPFNAKRKNITYEKVILNNKRSPVFNLNNPGCPACKETREQISASAMLTDLINQGIIKVLAVYPDEDLKEWYDYQPNMPENWINSYDKALAMRDKELYDLRAIPTLYLLDENKTVLLKDCMSIPTIEQVIYYRDYYNQQQ